MEYLLNLGFETEKIEIFKEILPEKALETLIKEQDKVTSNINFLKDLGVSNYQIAFTRFYNMFLLDAKDFEEIFSKYDKDDLVAKLEKNVAIMEYL